MVDYLWLDVDYFIYVRVVVVFVVVFGVGYECMLYVKFFFLFNCSMIIGVCNSVWFYLGLGNLIIVGLFNVVL